MRLLRPLAEKGNPDAQINLGNMYFDGNGVPQDNAESVKWYLLAADQGSVDAQIALGFLYEYGDAVHFDYVRAYKWFDLAGSGSDRDIVATMMNSRADRRSAEARTRVEAEVRALYRRLPSYVAPSIVAGAEFGWIILGSPTEAPSARQFSHHLDLGRIIASQSDADQPACPLLEGFRFQSHPQTVLRLAMARVV